MALLSKWSYLDKPSWPRRPSWAAWPVISRQSPFFAHLRVAYWSIPRSKMIGLVVEEGGPSSRGEGQGLGRRPMTPRTTLAAGICAGLAFEFVAMAEAQTPPPPAPPAVTMAPPPQKTIWGFFGLSRGNLDECRSKLGRSQLGSVLGNTLKPVSLFSGGLIGGPSPAAPGMAAPGGASSMGPAGAAAAPASGPMGAQAASAKIQQYQAQSKTTIESIEYLATLDCHYWPEAEKALIDALRANRVECVRFAAARALERGCCCSKKTIEALRIVVEESEEDGNPSETSTRVKASAFRALQRCLCRPSTWSPSAPGAIDEAPAPIEPPVPALPSSPDANRGHAPGDSYYTDRLNAKNDRQVVASAWRSLAAKSGRMETPPPPPNPLTVAGDGRSSPRIASRGILGRSHAPSGEPDKAYSKPHDAAEARGPGGEARTVPESASSSNDPSTTPGAHGFLIMLPGSSRP
jgi:hypothetical protein